MKKTISFLCFVAAIATIISSLSITSFANSDNINDTFEGYNYHGVTDIYYDGIFSYLRSTNPAQKCIYTDYNVLYNGTISYYYSATFDSETTVFQNIYPSDNNHIIVACLSEFSIDYTVLGYLSLAANSWINDGEEPEDR